MPFALRLNNNRPSRTSKNGVLGASGCQFQPMRMAGGLRFLRLASLALCSIYLSGCCTGGQGHQGDREDHEQVIVLGPGYEQWIIRLFEEALGEIIENAAREFADKLGMQDDLVWRLLVQLWISPGEVKGDSLYVCVVFHRGLPWGHFAHYSEREPATQDLFSMVVVGTEPNGSDDVRLWSSAIATLISIDTATPGHVGLFVQMEGFMEDPHGGWKVVGRETLYIKGAICPVP